MFGQVVAHRAGCAGRVKQAWQLERGWRAAIAGEAGIPADARLSPWAKRLVLEAAEKAAKEGRIAAGGTKGRPHDVEAVRLAFLSIDQVLSPGLHWRSRANREVQATLIRLFASPHLFAAASAARIPRHAPKGWVGPWIEGDDLEELKAWAKGANWRVSMIVPDPRRLLVEVPDPAVRRVE